MRKPERGILIKVGDIVRMKPEWGWLSEKTGLVIGTEGEELIVFWDIDLSAELEYRSQLQVVEAAAC